MDGMSIALVSGPVPKDSSQIYYSFVFDEIYRLAKNGLNIHAIRSSPEKQSFSRGINYYGLNGSRVLGTAFLLKHFNTIPQTSYFLPPWTLLYLSKYGQTVSKIIFEKNLDLIHAHFAYPEGFVGLLAKKETGRPLVITVHGVDVLKDLSTAYGVRLNKRYAAMVGRALNEADAVIAASKATYNEVCIIVKDVEKTHLIPNGVDINRFNPNLDTSILREKLHLKNQTVIFSLRSHEPKYGLEYLIRSMPIVQEMNTNVIFIIGGDGSLRQYHEKLAAELDVKEKVIFPGRIPSEDLPYYYALSDIVVVPSLQEAFGLVVSEAMSCGKPVIGSNVGGIPDQIVDGNTGFLVEPKNPSKIAEKILWLSTNREEAKKMGLNGRKVVEQNYDIDKRTKSIISLYKQLLRK
jgi:glycosyltransferase involved in cell wall biosynthesis